MALTKSQKITLIANSLESLPFFNREEGETDLAFVTRVTQEKMNETKMRFLEQHLQRGIELQTPKEPIDVSDL